jgi:5-hydroxyisourate hydrolase
MPHASTPRISTHILDLSAGKPASGVPVQLEKEESAGNWRLLSSDQTDQDGRRAQLLKDDRLAAGVYRLRFDTETYFAARGVATLYPFVEVTFQVREGESHIHIPLLLSANGYTTYRGT